MTLFFWIVLGLLVAGIFKVVAWEDERGTMPIVAAGAAGAVLGGYLKGALLGLSDTPGFDPTTMVLAIVGAAVLVGAYHKLFARSTSAAPASHRRAA